MTTSLNGILLIKKMEGFRGTAYSCPGGTLTIGYGTTRGVSPNMTVTEAQADMLLRRDLVFIENQINSLGLRLKQNQFDALASLVYNIGWGNFVKSTLLRLTRLDPDHTGIPNEFRRWIYAAGKPMAGLSHRREAEIALYRL